MRNRAGLLAILAEGGDRLSAARRGAGALWRNHPVRNMLVKRLDELTGCDSEDVTAAITALLSNAEPISVLMADLVAAARENPFFDPPCATIGDGIHRGLVILDHPVALISLSVASSDAIAARKAMGGGAGSIGITGAVSIIRFHRSGQAVLRFWQADGARCHPLSNPHRCRDGEVLVVDGRSRGYVIEHCRSDIVMLRATLKMEQAALRREYDATSCDLVGLASNDEAASRAQMLLTLLRIQGRSDAADRFIDALGDAQHFIRWHAVREFLALDPLAALPHLRRLADGDPHAEVRAAARATLAAIRARNPALGEAAQCPA